MRYTLLLLLICISPITTYSGTTGKITGQVTDQNGDPLPGAAITIEGTKRGAIADEEGIYFLLSVDPGRHTLKASLISFESQQKHNVLVTSDFTTNINFTLPEKALPLGEIVVEAQAGESAGWGMFSIQATAPPVEPDRTTSIYTIRSEDIEALPTIRLAEEFIELQAGVSIDEDGDEITVRAGDPEDVAYYLDGIPIPTTDNVETRVYRDFNRLAIQEMTIVTGGMNAEYGNAQGGVISVVTREGGNQYSGLIDYQFTPPGQKHWGENAYDSPIHRGLNRWDDPAWVAETTTLPNGDDVQVHQRIDYTGISGHFLEGNLSGPLKKNLTFFLSSRWHRAPSVFPNADKVTPPNINTTGKLSYQWGDNKKLMLGNLYDYRQTPNRSPLDGGRLDIRNDGKNLFLATPKPTGDSKEIDHLFYAGLMHLLSPKTYYDIRISRSLSHHDTLNVPIPSGINHISEVYTTPSITDRENHYATYRQTMDWERFRNERWLVKADFSSQATPSYFFKVGFEWLRYNNWYQSYRVFDQFRLWGDFGRNQTSEPRRQASWYGKTYDDTDFFPGQTNKGLNPYQLTLYFQNKIERSGMVVNAGGRLSYFNQNTWVVDNSSHYGVNHPMYFSMTRSRRMPTIKGPPITQFDPRLGVSHPMGQSAIVRFFYGRFTQQHNFRHIFLNSWDSIESTDQDLNQNGVIDPAERWNDFNEAALAPNSYLPPEETISFEVGTDWNFWQDYVLSLTTYYKSANSQSSLGYNIWADENVQVTGDPNLVSSEAGRADNGIYRDTRGIEVNLKKRFSKMFAFNFGLNFQWSEQGRNGLSKRVIYRDSLFITNGHYWLKHDIDPATGEEIPISLQEMALRDGLPEDFYVEKFSHSANELIRRVWDVHQSVRFRGFSNNPNTGHHAAEGIEFISGQTDVSLYDSADRAYWKRINSQPGYPGTGEGNIIVLLEQGGNERVSRLHDRRSFGSLTFLFATPPTFGPREGQMLGNVRANLVYRFYTGTPFEFTPLGIDPATGLLVGSSIERRYGPIHTRTDIHLSKQFGDPEKVNLTLGLELYNFFNQKDIRAFPPAYQITNSGGIQPTRSIDFDPSLWQTYGIDGLQPIAANNFEAREVHDINNYWDSPREMKFSLRVKW